MTCGTIGGFPSQMFFWFGWRKFQEFDKNIERRDNTDESWKFYSKKIHSCQHSPRSERKQKRETAENLYFTRKVSDQLMLTNQAHPTCYVSIF